MVSADLAAGIIEVAVSCDIEPINFNDLTQTGMSYFHWRRKTFFLLCSLSLQCAQFSVKNNFSKHYMFSEKIIFRMERHMMVHWDLGPYTDYVCCGIVQGFATKQTGQAMPVGSFSIVLHMDCGQDTCAHKKVLYSRSPRSWLDLHFINNYCTLVCFFKIPVSLPCLSMLK